MNLLKQTVILGVDPGTRITGYAIIQTDGYRYRALDYGCIRLPLSASFATRVSLLFDEINHLFTSHPIDVVSIEGQYVHKNAQSALKLGMAKGVVLLAATKRRLPIHEYSPKQAKLSATGKGNATKEEVQKMIQTIFQLASPPTPIDAADALALAFCHFHYQKSKQLHEEKRRTYA